MSDSINSVYFQNAALKTRINKLKNRIEFLEIENTFLTKENTAIDFPYSFFIGLAIGWSMTYLKYAV